MGTFSTTTSNTFTLTHAKRIASKVATDLMRFRRYYGKPALSSIDEYEEELVVLLKHDVLKEVAYGFRKNGKWITAIKYQAIDGQLIARCTMPARCAQRGLALTIGFRMAVKTSHGVSEDSAGTLRIAIKVA